MSNERRFAPIGRGINASALTEGELPDERLSDNVPLLDASNAFSGLNIFTGEIRSQRTTGRLVHFRRPDGDTDAGRWTWWMDSNGRLRLFAEPDSGILTNAGFDITRSGETITGIRLDATEITLDGVVQVTGPITSSTATITINVPGDFATLQAAVDKAVEYSPSSRVTIHIQTGYTVTSGVSVDRRDLSHIIITSADAVVPVDLATGEDFFFIRDGAGPIINVKFDMDGTGRHGLFCFSARATVRPGGGIINAGERGVFAYRGSWVNIGCKPGESPACDFSGAGERGIYSYRGSHAWADGVNVSSAGNDGMRAARGSSISARDANVSNAGGHAVYGLDGSRVNVNDADLSNATLNAVRVDSGTIIATQNAVTTGSGSGAFNITANTVTSNGIIFN